jgi:membrane-associated protease RseP (regulator of RpoE activity)
MNDKLKTILRHSALFIATFITTTFAGAELCFGKSILIYGEEIGINADFTWEHFELGMQFSIPLLLFLTCHEFGHYFAAIYHKVKTSLPYYLPVPPIPMFSIGTLGAVIRLRSRPYSTKQFFDIGIAGPIAGFLMSLIILFYGFTTLPPADHIFTIHPEYKQYGADYAAYVYEPEFYQKELAEKKISGTMDVFVGKNLAFILFEQLVADPARVPNVHEVIHYPVLLAGLISLLFTALNLFPIGQLDGGQVIYGLLGDKRHRIIGSVALVVLLFYSGLGLDLIGPSMSNNWLLITIPGYIVALFFALRGLRMSRRDTAMYAVMMFAAHFILARLYPTLVGYSGWLLFALIIGGVIGVKHPTAVVEQPLDYKRNALGWFTLIVFILCFSPAPLDMKIFTAQQ